jgi:hypothetical protein
MLGTTRIFTYFHRSLSQAVGAQEIALTDVSDECSTVGVVTISWMMYVHHTTNSLVR